MTDRYGSVPPGFLCGRCDAPLSTKWDGRCEKCGARYIEFTPKASKNVPDPFGDSVALRRFRASCLVATVVIILSLVVLELGGGIEILVPALILGLAFSVFSYSRTRW